MKAAWRDRYGGPDVVYLRDVPKPVPAAGEVLVRVRAASVNRVDLDNLYPRWRFLRLFLGIRAPRQRYSRLGNDVAGTVEAVGEGVTQFVPGDDVFGDISGVASGPKLDFVRSLGADETIDYRTTDYTRPAERYDWIVEVDAHHPVRRWLGALNKGGVQQAFGGSAWWLLSSAILGPVLSLLTRKHVGVGFVMPFGERDVALLKKYVADGVIKPVIDRRFTLDEVAEALRCVDEGRNCGKVVVQMEALA